MKFYLFFSFSEKTKLYDKKIKKEIEVYPANLLRGIYDIEKQKEKSIKKSRNIFLENLKKLNLPFKLVDINQYYNCDSKIDFFCEKHGIFNTMARSIVNGGTGCPKCSYDKLKRSLDNFIKLSNEIHNDKYDYSKSIYINNITKLEIICHKHGSFWQRPKQHLRGEGCVYCNESKGEKKILYFLKKNRIKFIRQKEIEGCINKKTNRTLKFDFYLPDFDLLIEYDGQQHFLEKASGFYTEEVIKKTILLDEIKNEFCLKNNKNLLRITYKDFDNIENILNKATILKKT